MVFEMVSRLILLYKKMPGPWTLLTIYYYINQSQKVADQLKIQKSVLWLGEIEVPLSFWKTVVQKYNWWVLGYFWIHSNFLLQSVAALPLLLLMVAAPLAPAEQQRHSSGMAAAAWRRLGRKGNFRCHQRTHDKLFSREDDGTRR